MFKSCKYCGSIHDESFVCSLKPKRKFHKNSKAFKFRNTAQWQMKRDEVKTRDKYLCAVCLNDNKLNYKDLEVHHIIPIDVDYDLRLDNNNLITLCRHHHKLAELGEIDAKFLKSLVPPSSANN